ncbi:flagellar filament capping protein FliD [Bacillus horti]|uniref:Flagellar hook-associated protein 2 n=1 Tax=Caldalkalibacillus horti TaxID=77523 RepID=A0ABT9VZA7_9BACI|nr:flagellar filament capping protein FliD [Bacillus horti]MDQ0166333.1 flagellar hook-associated protein 2 [Bacillus horti]
MRIGGMFSGMDTDTMVKQIMQAERAPLDRLFQKKQWTEWQQDAYRGINLSLATFNSAHSSLRLGSSFSAFKATSSNSSVVTATAQGNATPGSYTISNVQLARSAALNSENALSNLEGSRAKGTDTVLESGTQTFTITNQAGLTAEITVDENDTFQSLAQKINSAKDAEGNSLGLRASFDNTTSRFYISTREMGEGQGFSFEDTAFVRDMIFGGSSTLSAQGSDASFTYNGVEVTGQTSNTVRVNGVDFNLLQASGAEPITINVQGDPDKLVDQIKSFVEAYNELIGNLESLLIEPKYRDFAPLTDEQRRELSEREAELWDEKAMSGLLRSDSILRKVADNLRSAFTSPVEGIPSGEFSMLSQIGITTGSYEFGGKLFIDEDKLRSAISERPDEVTRLFTQTSEDRNIAEMGIGQRVYSQVNSAINELRERAGTPGSPNIDSSNIGERYKNMNDQINRWQDRLALIENRYWRQFTAMERALAQMESQNTWMMQNMFGGM